MRVERASLRGPQAHCTSPHIRFKNSTRKLTNLMHLRSASVPTRIISLVVRYDRLCSPETEGLPALLPREALRPSSLPADVQAWLSPRQRLAYFLRPRMRNRYRDKAATA